MNTLEVKEISKSFGSRLVLDKLSFDWKTGDIIAIFGRNGSGKSTLLKAIFGTISINNGKILYNGKEVKSRDIISRQLIAYLPQDSFLPTNARVKDIIPLFYSGDAQDKIFYSPAIPKISDKKIGTLSLGELRYFELLLLSYLDHPFIMLDEPFSTVEPLFKEYIKEHLLKIKVSKCIIITDHYYRDVLAISNHYLLIKNGRATIIEGEKELRNNGYLPEI